jgi:hypothetical protein
MGRNPSPPPGGKYPRATHSLSTPPKCAGCFHTRYDVPHGTSSQRHPHRARQVRRLRGAPVLPRNGRPAEFATGSCRHLQRLLRRHPRCRGSPSAGRSGVDRRRRSDRRRRPSCWPEEPIVSRRVRHRVWEVRDASGGVLGRVVASGGGISVAEALRRHGGVWEIEEVGWIEGWVRVSPAGRIATSVVRPSR